METRTKVEFHPITKLYDMILENKMDGLSGYIMTEIGKIKEMALCEVLQSIGADTGDLKRRLKDFKDTQESANYLREFLHDLGYHIHIEVQHASHVGMPKLVENIKVYKLVSELELNMEVVKGQSHMPMDIMQIKSTSKWTNR